MNNILNRSALRYFFRHPLQLILSLLGIALGVAVVVAIDLANESSSRAFELSMESVAGNSTHQIIGGPEGIPDSLYGYLKIINIEKAAPIVEGNVALVHKPVRVFTLMGVDPFAEGPFRPYLSSVNEKLSGSIRAFLTQPSSVMISAPTAAQLGIKSGDTATIKIGGSYRKIHIIGLINPENERSRNIMESLMLADISTAQELLNTPGFITRIDLIIPDNSSGTKILKNIQSRLPQGFSVRRSEARTQIAADMIRAFDINLTALSLLALIVGMFLIYNTMTFSVVRRRNYIGLLRSVGVTQKDIFRLFLKEALLLAIAGTTLGILAGIVLGKGMIQLVTQTINDLYFVVSVRDLNISVFSLAKGFFIGIGATLLAALKPSYEASSVPPRLALSRSEEEIKLRKKIPRFSILGALFLSIGAVILALPGKNIILSYAGILPVILGFALLTPLMILIFIKLINNINGRLFGVLGKMAGRSIVTQISRTAIAVAALSIAVSSTVGIGTMINSFRQTVVTWLQGHLEADIYISPPGLVLRQNDATLDSSLVKKILALPEVRDYNYYREAMLNTGQSQIHMIALNIGQRSYKDFKFKEGNPQKIWSGFQNEDAVMVTEPYAYRNNIHAGDELTIPTDKGIRNFRVLGVYYDYASDMGIVAMSFNTYKRHWNNHSISGLSLFIDRSANRDSLIDYISGMPGNGGEILVRSNSYLLKSSIEVFDRSFLITNVLQVLAVIVAFIGILSSLMALQLERSREFAILRANGLTPSQLWKLLSIQTGLMGLISGLLSLPLGNTLAWILIYIINKRSFGWTLQFIIVPHVIIQALLISLVAAILAGFYPAYKMSHTSPAFALREE